MTEKEERLFIEGFHLGFMMSREGFNSQYSFEHCFGGLEPYCSTEGAFRSWADKSESFQEGLSDAIERVKTNPPEPGSVSILIKALHDLATPVTRADYSVGKLDEVVRKIAQEALDKYYKRTPLGKISSDFAKFEESLDDPSARIL
jgi:hypothetical protein